MKSINFLIFFLIIPFFLQALAIQDKLRQARPGDFIVTQQAKNYSLLSVHTVSKDSIILEEITVPVHKIDIEKVSWKGWIASHAPGYTSWILYEIGMEDGKLKQCYSLAAKAWLFIDESEYFFSRLMTLALTKTPYELRKRIGPSPAEGNPDHRSLWNPPLVIEGKKLDKPRFDVYRTTWPKDNTPLSLTEVELYFNSDTPSFPFPHWIEVKHGHYDFKVRCIDSGTGMISPIRAMPQRGNSSHLLDKSL